MAFKDIIKRIQQDAQKQAEVIKTDATKQSETIIAEAQKKIDTLKKELKERAQQRASEKEMRIVTLARLDLRKMILKAKQDQIETAFTKAYEKLVNLKDDEYKKFIKTVLLDIIETGEEVIIPPANGRLALTNQIIDEINKEIKDKSGKLSLSEEKRKLAGGFIIRRGKQEINYSLEALVSNIREELELQVVQILFQES